MSLAKHLRASLLIGVAASTSACKCEHTAELLVTGHVLGVNVTLPDDGDKPGLILTIDLPSQPYGEPCPYAIYQFSDEPRLSAADVEAVVMGAATETSDFGGVLVKMDWLGRDGAREWAVLADPFVDTNPLDTTIVALVCPGKAPSEVLFLAETGCVLGEDVHLEHGPSLREVEVSIE